MCYTYERTMSAIKKIIGFFDKLEYKIRSVLSHSPIIYALIGAIGIILMWKGVEETAGLLPILFGPGSFILGALILLLTGLLVSFFIGDSIIISGFKKEKKLVEKAESEVRSEQEMIEDLEKKVERLDSDVNKLAARR